MKGYSARDVATMLGLSVAQVRSFASTALIAPERGEKGEYRFTFQDLVLLRAAKELTDARIPPRRIKRSLLRLREQLPAGRPLTAVRIAADGERVIVRDGETLWNPDSGQELFDFAVSELETRVAPFAAQKALAIRDSAEERSADEWYELGCDLEFGAVEEAIEAYRRAIALQPGHSDAYVNLGRILHERDVMEAERHYRLALAVDPSHPTALFNLGVALEDQRRFAEARRAYEQAIAADPDSADAHYNLAGLLESEGSAAAALKHLKEYKRLIGR